MGNLDIFAHTGLTLDTRVLSCEAVVMNDRKLFIAEEKLVYFFTRGFTQPLSCATCRSCMNLWRQR
jgi:hypothetical protein